MAADFKVVIRYRGVIGDSQTWGFGQFNQPNLAYLARTG